MHLRQPTAALLAVVLSCAPLAAQPLSTHRSFERLTPRHGLVGTWVRALHQDIRGFIWIGTSEGLNRYDGYGFMAFRARATDPAALLNDDITSLAEDSTGRLWIATLNGLHAYDRRSGRFSRYKRRAGTALDPDDELSHIEYDPRGALWVATASRGFFRFDLATGAITDFRHTIGGESGLRHDSIQAMVLHPSGVLWLATPAGLELYDPALNKFELIGSRRGRPVMSRMTTIQLMRRGQDNDVWLGLRSGEVMRVRTGTGPLDRRIESPLLTTVKPGVTALWEDAQGRLWIGCASGGLTVYDLRTGRSSIHTYREGDPHSFNGLSPSSILQDRSGILWIGSDAGVNTTDLKTPKFHNQTFDFRDGHHKEHNEVWSIAEDAGGVLWVGTNGTLNDPGLIRFDRATGTYRMMSTADPDRRSVIPNVYTFQHAPDGTIWAGSYGEGMFVIDPAISKVYHLALNLPDKRIRSFWLDAGLQLWVGVPPTGVHLFGSDGRSIRSFMHDPADSNSLASNSVVSMRKDRSGTMWIGTVRDGLSRFAPSTGVWTTFRHRADDPTSLTEGAVFCIFEDRSGRLWIGTGRGLNRMDRATNSFRRVALDGRLDDARIYSMLEDDQGRMWIATPNALVRYQEEEGGPSLRVYETADGLQDGQFIRGSAYRCRHGEMFFGGTAGITSFFPDRVDDNPIVPPVAVVSFRIANHEVALPTTIEETRLIEVEHADNVLTFAFAAMEYTSPSKNQFAYRLEGFDAEWVYAGTDRFATYTNLDPGRYALHAKATNNDGRWSRETMLLTLIVHPPYWRTWWFRALIGLSIIGFAGMLVYRREVHVRTLRRAQEDFSKRLIAEQEAERQRIASELHDGLGQNILIIKNKALLAVQRFRPGRSVKGELEGISDLASQTLEDTRRISRNLRPYLLDRFGLTEALKEMVEAIQATSPLRWEVEIAPIDRLVPTEQQINLYRVVQEALTNIVRHARATEASVQVAEEAGRIFIDIRDNGRGMDGGHMSQRSEDRGGLGVVGIRERIRALGGTVEFRTAPGAGTWLSITIPIRHEADHSSPHR